MFSSIPFLDFTMHKSFQVHCYVKIHKVMFWCMFPVLKVFFMEKSVQDLEVDIKFPSDGSGMLHTLKVSSYTYFQCFGMVFFSLGDFSSRQPCQI